MQNSNKTANKIPDTTDKLLAGKRLDPEIDFSLDEFANLYHMVSKQSGVGQRVDVVLHNDRALGQFTSLLAGKGIVYIRSDRRLTRQDFSRIDPEIAVHGDVLTSTIRERLREERANLLLAGGIGFIFTILLVILGNTEATNYAGYLIKPDSFPSVERTLGVMTKINEMLLTSATIFLSIFLVFTVAQSSKLQEDIRLFDEGLLHKFEQDDRLVAIVAVVSLLLNVLNITVLGMPFSWEISSWQIGGVYTLTLNKMSLVSPLITGVTIATLVFCFLALLYYLKRTMLITNRDMSERVLARARESVQAKRDSPQEP